MSTAFHAVCRRHYGSIQEFIRVAFTLFDSCHVRIYLTNTLYVPIWYFEYKLSYLDKKHIKRFYSLCVSAYPTCVCIFVRCLIQTVRRQRRLMSAAEGWRLTWGSLRCGATLSPSAAPPTRHHHPGHSWAPAPTLGPWDVKL